IYLALETLEQQRLVRPMLAPASSYEFTHPLIHQAAYQSLGTARRRALHRHAAVVLQRRGFPAGTLAEHFRQGEQWAEALQLFTRAADEAAEIHAVQSAIGYLERAIEAAEAVPARPEDRDPNRLAGLLERLGDLRDLDGDWQGALNAYERALPFVADQPETGGQARVRCKIGDIRGRGRDSDLALAAYEAAGGPESPAPIRAAILLGRARIAYVRASYAEAAALAAAARDLLKAGPPDIELEARSINALGNAAQGQGDLERAAAWFNQGIREATVNGQARWLSHFQHHLARVVWAQGDLAAAEQHLLDALTLAEHMGDQHTQANCRRTLGVLAAVRGLNDQATAWYEQSLAIAERSGDLFGMVHAHHNLGIQAMIRGDFPAARGAFDRNLSLAEELADRQLIAGALNGLGRLAIVQGDYGSADRLLRQSLPLCEEMGNPPLLGHVLYQLADLTIEQGKLEEAAALRARARALSGIDPEDMLQIDLLDAKALLYAGRPREAIAGLIETARRIDATGITFLAVDAQILLAEAYLDRGEDGAPIARDISAAALQRARSHGDRLQEGRALRLLGRATEEQDERARLLEESLRLFREIGAATEIERTMRSVKGRVP
ncbi:MAG TPA: tetratricopeptide repeat protein, partial [Chloroflexota bacterium]|nr:tetratricopeptide repeat protein [Chloroflexota bacterium]